MLGTILIPAGLLILMNNERKLVDYTKIVTEARSECQSVTAHMPEDENDFKLVHTVGTPFAMQIGDRAFGAYVRDSYRLTREVEMYQWFEVRTETEVNGIKRVSYEYTQGWFNFKIDSRNFKRPEHLNPCNPWPFATETFSSNNVRLGMFRLNSEQCLKLGLMKTQY